MTKTNNNNKVERLPGGGFRGTDGKAFFCVPLEGDQMSWAIQEQEPVSLTEDEKKQAGLLNYDLEKLLLVKQLLSEEKTATDIYQETGISRNTVYNYKKILSLEYTKCSRKYSQSTRNTNSVLSMFLIFNSLSTQSTLLPFILVLLLLVVVGGGLLKSLRKAKAERKAVHKEEVKELRKAFYRVLDWTYKRKPILVTSQKEKAWHIKMLSNCMNAGREVHFYPPKFGEGKHMYNQRKNNYLKQYLEENKEAMNKGEEAYKDALESIKEQNLLGFFNDPEDTASRTFLLGFTTYYRANPQPVSTINTTNKMEWDNYIKTK